MNLFFSIIIPVYNRPTEVDELLASIAELEGDLKFEVIVVEDGSSLDCSKIVSSYKNDLNIHYHFTENQGAGKARNFGMQNAKGNYFIILDSDCLLPKEYLVNVQARLLENFTDAFGGPDAAHESFTNIQKAINYSMTSVLTTGGIRGKKKAIGKFQPRSFNFGISKKAFEQTKGFGAFKIGEDIDLTFRLWENKFETQLIEEAFVYHKRRISFQQFYRQTNNFGKTRPYLNNRFPGTAKITYWFPSVFLLGFLGAMVLLFFKSSIFASLYAFYFCMLLIHATFSNGSIKIGVLAILTTSIQFYGYGMGFLSSILNMKK